MFAIVPNIGSLSAVQRLRTETISDLDSFLCLKPAWDALVAAAGIDYPFTTHEWVRTWWECFGAGKVLHIVVVREGNAVVGIAPMLEETERFYGFRLRKLTFVWNAHVPRCDFIVCGQRLDVYGALWDHLAAENHKWDLLLLPQLPEESPTLTWFRKNALDNGFLVGIWNSDASPYVTITGAWEEYFESLPRKHRSNLRNRSARLLRTGSLDRETLSVGDDNFSTALEEGFQIEAAAWKGAAGTALLCDPQVRNFYSSLARTSGLSDSVRLHFLRSNGRRIAFDFSVCYGKVMYLFKGGYLPDYSPYSPFNTLSAMNLESCFRDGLERYDFLGKEEEWKGRWCTRSRSHHWMFIYPNNPRTALFHAMKFRLAPIIKDLTYSADRGAAAHAHTASPAGRG